MTALRRTANVTDCALRELELYADGLATNVHGRDDSLRPGMQAFPTEFSVGSEQSGGGSQHSSLERCAVNASVVLSRASLATAI